MVVLLLPQIAVDRPYFFVSLLGGRQSLVRPLRSGVDGSRTTNCACFEPSSITSDFFSAFGAAA
jgi:hypothetical protein